MAAEDPLFAGLRPGWRELLAGAGLEAGLLECMARAEADGPAEPPRARALEALRFVSPGDVCAVVLGQDPYPRDATGLSFAGPPGAAVPASLARVFGALRAGGRMPPQGGPDGQGPPGTPDLRAWAAQGVLLLNAALTTRAGARDAHRFWHAATEPLLAAVMGAAPGARLLLWGAAAARHAARAAAVAGGGWPGRTHAWGHPSPLSDNRAAPERRFVNCPHFAAVDAAREAAGAPPVCWDPRAASLAFTDGACRGNGKRGAWAGFGVYVASGPARGARVSGLVAPARYALAGSVPLPGAGEHVPPTNNRGELLGVAYALAALLAAEAGGDVEIVSDSKYAIGVVSGAMKSTTNDDLVGAAQALLAALRARVAPAEVRFTRVRASHDVPAPSDGDGDARRARALWLGNREADALACAPCDARAAPPAGALPTYTAEDLAVRVESPGCPALQRLNAPGI